MNMKLTWDRLLFVLAILAGLGLFLQISSPSQRGGFTPTLTDPNAPAASSQPALTRNGWTWDDIAHSDFATSLREAEYGFSALESIHLIGVALFFGAILMMDLRLVGVMPRVPIRQLSELLLPVTWIGFLTQLASGGLLFIAYADQYVRTVSFPVKMGLVLIGGINMLFFHKTVWKGVSKWNVNVATPAAVQVMAMVSIVLWSGAMVAGRWAGYERRPVPPGQEQLSSPAAAAAAAGGGGAASSATTILSTKEYMPNVFAISVEAGVKAEELAAIAKKACGDRAVCQVGIWEVQGPQANYRFAYSIDKNAKTEKSQWDCMHFTSVPQQSCLPN